MKNKKVILYLLLIIIFINSIKALSNPLENLKSLYEKQGDIYKDYFINILKEKEKSIIDINNIYIFPILSIKDTNLFLYGDRREFYESLIIDTSFSFYAIIYINDLYYKYVIRKKEIVGKSCLPKEIYDHKILKFKKSNENYTVFLFDSMFLPIICYWYIDENEIKVSSINFVEDKNVNKKTSVSVIFNNTNLFDYIRDNYKNE